MIPKLNMSQIDKMTASHPLRGSARVDPNVGLQEYCGSERLVTGESRGSSGSQQASSRLTTDRISGGSARGGGGGVAAPQSSFRYPPPTMAHPSHHHYTNSGVSNSSVIAAAGTAGPSASTSDTATPALGRRSLQVQHLIGFDPLDCTDVGSLQRRLVELAEKLLQLESFYDEQHHNRYIWYQQRLSALTNCISMPSPGGGAGTSHPGRSSVDLSTAGGTSGSSHHGVRNANAAAGFALPSTSFTSVPSLPFSPRQTDGASMGSIPAGTSVESGLGSPLSSVYQRGTPSLGEDRLHRVRTTRRSGTSSGMRNVSASATLNSAIGEATVPSTSRGSTQLSSPSIVKDEERKKKKPKSKRQK